MTVSHDNAGNLIDDGTLVYAYDAWNRLVLVRSAVDSSVTIQTSEFDATGRRMKKVVTNSGDLDATTVYLYAGHQIAETRNGSGTMVSQFIHGTQYIDELVMERVADRGEFYVHQDANWNTIGLTTPAGKLAEEYNYTPYGQAVAKRHIAFGDADGDGDVDSTDNTAWQATPGDDGTGTFNRSFDADWDGDNGGGIAPDDLDKRAYETNYLAAGTSIEVSGRAWSPNGNPYLFTGRELDTETELMHYRARAYHPTLKQFGQKDPIGYAGGPNRYEYVGRNPNGFADPYGLDRWVVSNGFHYSLIIGPIFWGYDSNGNPIYRYVQYDLAIAGLNPWQNFLGFFTWSGQLSVDPSDGHLYPGFSNPWDIFGENWILWVNTESWEDEGLYYHLMQDRNPWYITIGWNCYNFSFYYARWKPTTPPNVHPYPPVDPGHVFPENLGHVGSDEDEEVPPSIPGEPCG